MKVASTDPARVRAAIDEVLARAEFRPPSKGPLEWLGEKILELIGALGRLFGIEGLSVAPVLWILRGLAVIAILALAVLVVRRVLARRAARGSAASSALDPEAARRRRVDELRAEARRARESGDRVRALRLYFFALVIGLSERGDLEYRDAWTNRELFERGAPRTDAARELAALVPDLDRKSFGGEPAAEEDVERLAALCARWLDRAA